MRRDPDRPIALIGLMGAGKSAVAHALGEQMAASVADLDALLVADTGRTVAELFAGEGELAFRRRESLVLRRALAAGARVLACGGGVVLDPDNRRLLKEHCDVVWLEVSPREAARRVDGDPTGRPLLEGGKPEAVLVRLLGEREVAYRETATVRVSTDGRTPEEVASEVLDALRGV